MALTGKPPSFSDYVNRLGASAGIQNWPSSTRGEIEKYLQNARPVISTGAIQTAKPSVPPESMESDQWRFRLLCARLRVPEGVKAPFQHLDTAWIGEKVFVFVVQKDTPVVLEDPSSLFPSDTLVTALRLLIE